MASLLFWSDFFMDISNKQAIVVTNDFTNKHEMGHGSTIDKYIQGYSARADATQSIPQVGMAREWLNHLDWLDSEGQFLSNRDFDDLANDYLTSQGVSFNQDSLSLSPDTLSRDAHDIQQAYLDGHSVQKIVISFDTDYLIEQNTVDLDRTKDINGNYNSQSFPGGGFDLVDDLKLRYAVQRGMNDYLSKSQMLNPRYVGALQFDRQHVHAHVACVDTGSLADSPRLIMYNSFWQDRGKLYADEYNQIRDGIDEALTFTKGLHRSSVNNQKARELVGLKSMNNVLQRQVQERLANQLLQLLRLQEMRKNREENDDLYWNKLGDYRDSLVMQEAKRFDLPESMTKKVNKMLDESLDLQIQQLNQQGIPAKLADPQGILQQELGQRLQDQAHSQQTILEDRQLSTNGWLKAIDDYDQKMKNKQTGNGSFAMRAFYGHELTVDLQAISAIQGQNPLNLLGNYQHRTDLVSQRKRLLDKRTKIVEEGYACGALINADQRDLRETLDNPEIQLRMLDLKNSQQEPWSVRPKFNFKYVEELPEYRDLSMKANSSNNDMAVNLDSVKLLQNAGANQALVSSLAGAAFNPQVRQLLRIRGGQSNALDSRVDQLMFVHDLIDYQRDVMKFNTEGVKRGLMNSEEFGQMADVWPVPEIKRPLDCRNAEVLKSDQGVIDQGSTAEKFHYLSLEQMFLDEAHLFLQASRQNSFEVTQVQSRHDKQVSELEPTWQEQLHVNSSKNRENKTDDHFVEVTEDLAKRQHQRELRMQRQRRLLRQVRKHEMDEREAQNVVKDSRKIVHQVLTTELER